MIVIKRYYFNVTSYFLNALAKDDFFELERLVKLVQQYYPLNMEDLNSLIFSKLDEWRGNKRFVDDTAIFSCRFF